MSNQFSIFSDGEIITFFKKTQNENYFLEMRKRYQSKIKKEINQFLYSNRDEGISFDELSIVADETLFKALKKYDQKRGKFYSFFLLMLKQSLIDYVLLVERQRGGIYYDSSLDAKVDSTLMESYFFSDIIGNIDENINSFVFVDEVNKMIDESSELSSFEKKVAKLVIFENYTVKETARILKSYENKIYICYRKVRKYLTLTLSSILGK